MSIPLNQLAQWEGNVRKTNAGEDRDELTASTAAHGLLSALTVKQAPEGGYIVIAGQRRLLALLALAEAGRIEHDAPVYCTILNPDTDAAEASLAENVVRTAMHPADQFDAWRDLADRGLSPADDLGACVAPCSDSPKSDVRHNRARTITVSCAY